HTYTQTHTHTHTHTHVSTHILTHFSLTPPSVSLYLSPSFSLSLSQFFCFFLCLSSFFLPLSQYLVLFLSIYRSLPSHVLFCLYLLLKLSSLLPLFHLSLSFRLSASHPGLPHVDLGRMKKSFCKH